MSANEDGNEDGVVDERMAPIIERTGYTHEITPGQRKYGGPPPGWDGPEPGAGCEVYCGKIPKSVWEDELIPLFEQYGTIYDLRLMMDPTTGAHKGFCFCLFSDKSEAKEAAKRMDGYEIAPGKKLKCNVSIPNCRLFVGNIPKSKGKDELMEEFGSRAEGLTDVIVYTQPDDPRQKNRGFCFLDFETHKLAAEARKKLLNPRNKLFNGNILIDWAEPQKEVDEEIMSKVKVLYVRNLKADITEELMKETFGQYGEIEKVKKIKDYGFVHFVQREDALQAMEALHGATLNDSEMEVSLAKPPSADNKNKDKKMGFGGFGGRGGRGLPPGLGGRGFGRGGSGLMFGRGLGLGRGGGSMLGSLGRGAALRGLAAAAAAAQYDYYGWGGEYDDGSGYYDATGYEDYYGADYSGYDDYSGYLGFGAAATGALGGLGGLGRGGGRGAQSLLGSLGRGGGGIRGAPRGGAARGLGLGKRPPRGGAQGGRGGAGRGTGSRGAGAGMKRKAEGGFNQPQAKAAKVENPWAAMIEQGGEAGGEEAWYQDSFSGSQQWG